MSYRAETVREVSCEKSRKSFFINKNVFTFALRRAYGPVARIFRARAAGETDDFTGNKYINHNRDEKDFSTFTEKEDQQARLP